MVALASTDVTVTINDRRKVNGNPTRWHNDVTVAFGDGALTYPTGGVPMPAAGSFGMKNAVLEKLLLDDESSGLLYKVTYDETNNKLFMAQYDYNNAADGPALELVTATAPAAISLKCTAVGF